MSLSVQLKRIAILAAIAIAQVPFFSFAHCDTMNGPVVQDAKTAIEKKDTAPILKWIKPTDEKEIREVFQQTLAVREKGDQARELADKYFFETLVRVHRAGEGAPYTGLKPADTKLEPGVAEADKALETGSADALTKKASELIVKGIQKRFENAYDKKKHADHNAEAGREYVEAYVQYVHFVERIFADAAASEPLHNHEASAMQNEQNHKEHSAPQKDHSHHE